MAQHIQVVGISDIEFRAPVDVGTVLSFTSQIVHTEDEFVVVHVEAEAYDVIGGILLYLLMLENAYAMPV